MLFFLWETCDDGLMPAKPQLRDVYRFPGFEPLATVRGVFGDPYAVVVTLQRRRKKRCAVLADRCRRFFTISGRVAFGTCPVATSVSMSSSPFGACRAGGVVP